MTRLPSLRIIHATVNKRAERLHILHADRLKCSRGCHDCCQDDLTVFEVEAKRIIDEFKDVLENELPHAPGKCAFLDKAGSCRIYSARPYVCRTQGLPLRWIDGSYEYRDICPLNEEGAPIEELPEEQCWTLGEVEGELAQLQVNSKRVKLRELFSDRELDSERVDR